MYEGVLRMILVIWIKPAKDGSETRAPVPMWIMRKTLPGQPSHPLCAHAALARLIRSRRPLALVAAWPETPLFAGARGLPVHTAYVRELVRLVARLLGLPPMLFGGSSARIGGATDLYYVYGADGARLIRERGRWHTDIAFIYQRANVSSHLSASASMVDATGLDLESFALGWSMRPYAQSA